MKIKLIITVVIALILIFGFFSYTFYSDIDAISKIKISINDIKIEEIGLSSSKLKLIIDISNPSDRDITDLKANFKILISDNHIGDGAVSKMNIPSKSSKIKEVLVTIYYSNVAVGVINSIKNMNFKLSIKGTADVKIFFELIKFSEKFQTSQSYP
jgi:hypothetical protein